MTPEPELLRRLTRTLLDNANDPMTLRPEVVELAGIFERLSERAFVRTHDIASGESATAEGLAVSPVTAAMCAQHFVRTIAFLRGLHAAILDARGDISDRPVRVFYAGCGPYATLAIPLLSVLPPEAVTFELIDLHPESIESARHIVDALGFSQAVRAYHTGDIRDVTLPPDALPDVIVTEVMQRALDREPQVAVTRHLMPQAPEARWVPEEIRVSLAVEASGESRELGTAFVLDREDVGSWPEDETEHLSGGTVTLDAPIAPGADLTLTTWIRTYGPHTIEPKTSSLTQPKSIRFAGTLAAGSRIVFGYALGCDPRVLWGLLPPESGVRRARKRLAAWLRPPEAE